MRAIRFLFNEQYQSLDETTDQGARGEQLLDNIVDSPVITIAS